MTGLRFVDVVDLETFGLVPPCADPRFDHRTCDYWEDADRGTKQARPRWLESSAGAPAKGHGPGSSGGHRARDTDNPFVPPLPQTNPFAPAAPSDNPFAFPTAHASQSGSRSAALAALADDATADPAWNPFAASRPERGSSSDGLPRKLALLVRGRKVFGSYAKVALADDEPVAWTQFGPLSAYPRASRLRELYPRLPESPLPAVITCIATTEVARRHGYARELVREVCRDLAGRGFSAVEAYPDLTLPDDETSAGRPAFWMACGFRTAAADERFPVMRRELE